MPVDALFLLWDMGMTPTCPCSAGASHQAGHLGPHNRLQGKEDCVPCRGVGFNAKEGGVGWVSTAGARSPELLEEEAVSQVGRIYRTPCLAYIKSPTNGSY